MSMRRKDVCGIGILSAQWIVVFWRCLLSPIPCSKTHKGKKTSFPVWYNIHVCVLPFKYKQKQQTQLNPRNLTPHCCCPSVIPKFVFSLVATTIALSLHQPLSRFLIWKLLLLLYSSFHCYSGHNILKFTLYRFAARKSFLEIEIRVINSATSTHWIYCNEAKFLFEQKLYLGVSANVCLRTSDTKKGH